MIVRAGPFASVMLGLTLERVDRTSIRFRPSVRVAANRAGGAMVDRPRRRLAKRAITERHKPVTWRVPRQPVE